MDTTGCNHKVATLNPGTKLTQNAAMCNFKVNNDKVLVWFLWQGNNYRPQTVREGFCPGWVSWGDLCPVGFPGGVSPGESLSKGGYLSSGGLCQGDPRTRTPRMVTSQRCASYWNVFLFLDFFSLFIPFRFLDAKNNGWRHRKRSGRRHGHPVGDNMVPTRYLHRLANSRHRCRDLRVPTSVWCLYRGCEGRKRRAAQGGPAAFHLRWKHGESEGRLLAAAGLFHYTLNTKQCTNKRKIPIIHNNNSLPTRIFACRSTSNLQLRNKAWRLLVVFSHNNVLLQSQKKYYYRPQQ